MFNSLRVSVAAAMLTIALLPGSLRGDDNPTASQRRSRREASKAAGIALNRERMVALRAALGEQLPLTPDVLALKPEWNRRLAAKGELNYASIRTTQQELGLGAHAAEGALVAKFMTLAIHEAHNYLSGTQVAMGDDGPELFPALVIAATGLAHLHDQSFVYRAAALLGKTADAFANARLKLEACTTMAQSAELQGRYREAVAARKAALEVVAKTDDRAAAISALEYAGNSREQAERVVDSSPLNLLSSYYGLVARVITSLPQAESRSAVRVILERAAKQSSFVGLDALAIAIAAHAAGESQLARALTARAPAALDGAGFANQAMAKPKPSAGASPVLSASRHPTVAARLRLLDLTVNTSGNIDPETWQKIATAASEVNREAVAANATASGSAGGAALLKSEQESKRQLVTDARAVVRAFELGTNPESLAELYSPTLVAIPVDISYLLDRIGDPQLRLALLALDVMSLERTRATLETRDRTAFFASMRARRAYRSLLGAMVARGEPSDLDRALAIGELARARQFKEIAGSGLSSFDQLLGDPRAFSKKVHKALGDRKALLSFHDLEDGGVLAFVVARGKIHVFRPSPSPNSLASLTTSLRTAIAGRVDPQKEQRALYDALIQPALTLIGSGRVLLVVPDGDLVSIPFEALVRSDGRRLIEDHEVRYLPAIASLTSTPSRAKASGLFAMGDPVYSALGTLVPPPLHDTREEVESIAAHFSPAETWLGVDASETKLKEADLRRFALVHLATHGILGGLARGYAEPGLLLTSGAKDDGVLTMSEAQQLARRRVSSGSRASLAARRRATFKPVRSRTARRRAVRPSEFFSAARRRAILKRGGSPGARRRVSRESRGWRAGRRRAFPIAQGARRRFPRPRSLLGPRTHPAPKRGAAAGPRDAHRSHRGRGSFEIRACMRAQSSSLLQCDSLCG